MHEKKILSSLSQQVAPGTVLTADLFSPPRGFGGREARLFLSAPPPFQSVSFSSLLKMDVDAEDDEGDAAAHNWGG